MLQIEINPKTALQLVGKVNEFHVVDDQLLLVSRVPPMLSMINLKGDLVWQLHGGEDDPLQQFTGVWETSYNEYDRTIEVMDANRLNMFYYDLEGQFQGRESLPFLFSDKLITADGCRIYDVSTYKNEWDDGPTRKAHFLKSCSADSLRVAHYLQKPFYDHKIPFVDFQNFFSVPDQVLYQPNFSDTIFSYDGELTPAFTVDVQPSKRTKEILNDPAIDHEIDQIFQEDLPFLIDALPLGDHIIGNYGKGYNYYTFALDRNTSEEVLNSNIMEYKGTVFEVPVAYNRGHFLSQLYTHRFEYLQHYAYPDITPTVEATEQYTSDQQRLGDTDGMVLILLAPK